MRRKIKKEVNDDQIITEMKEMYQHKLNEQEALRNLLLAIEKRNPQDEPVVIKKRTKQ